MWNAKYQGTASPERHDRIRDQTSPTTEASRMPAGTVIAIRTQALCQGRLYV